VLDLACPVFDTGESSRVFWIPAFAGMTNARQAAGNAPEGIIQCKTHRNYLQSIYLSIYNASSEEQEQAMGPETPCSLASPIPELTE
jgi:hypothetical protein